VASLAHETSVVFLHLEKSTYQSLIQILQYILIRIVRLLIIFASSPSGDALSAKLIADISRAQIIINSPPTGMQSATGLFLDSASTNASTVLALSEAIFPPLHSSNPKWRENVHSSAQSKVFGVLTNTMYNNNCF
jgi:hypothetical protein